MKKILLSLFTLSTFLGLGAQSQLKRIDLDSFYSFEHDASIPLFTALDSNLVKTLSSGCGDLNLRLVFDSIPGYMIREDQDRNIINKYKITDVVEVSKFVTLYYVSTEVGLTIYTVALDKNRNLQVYCHWINKNGMVEGWQSVTKF